MEKHARGDTILHASWQFSAEVKEELADKRRREHGESSAQGAASADEDYDDEDDDEVVVDERATRKARRGHRG